MKSFEDYIVPWVRSAAPYSDKHMDFAWSHPQVVRMMSNENLIPPSPRVLAAVQAAARLGNLYPGSGEELRRKLGAAAGLGAENVLLGNGSTDIINIAVNTFIAPGEQAIIPSPTFSMYAARVKVNGGLPVEIPISPAPQFYWDIEAMLAAIGEKTRLIFICTPNNPTGNQVREADLRRILERNIPTFIDEAYYELEEQPRSWAFLVREYPHAIVSRTMSKAYGLAGFRIGYALANADLVDYFNRVRIPWNVSLVSIAAALAALEDEEEQRRKNANNDQGRRYLCEAINSTPGLHAFPSEGNFVLIDATTLMKSSEQMRDDLIQRGVFIRPMTSHHMPPGFIRVTVGTAPHNQRLVELLREYAAQALAENSP